MNILVTLNSNYIKPLMVMLKSLFLNNAGETFNIYLMHSSLKGRELLCIDKFISQNGHHLFVIKMHNEDFNKAPVTSYYTKEIYYRLLAFKFLPSNLHRILYLDPDILVINPIRKLYDTDISGYLYAAAFHNRMSTKEVNKLRLFPYNIEEYFNSGVLLMNLDLQRQKIDEKEIYGFVSSNKNRLILPDQDIINALYSKQIKKIDEVLFNYDARYYIYYKIASKGVVNMDYIIYNTSIIHFCGKKKPWNKNYNGKFHSLYKHYEKLAMAGNGQRGRLSKSTSTDGN
ncbi:MAG: glycosyltransferase family 8 protein [Clostridiales bacterium]|nr:glycosyltransferase family 8 protein [Clostridiales bacterium]